MKLPLRAGYPLAKMNNKKAKTSKYKKVSCPHCNCNDVVRRGYFLTKAHGKQQRYFCKKCNKKFIVRTGFYRMRNTPEKITCALDLFFRGVSTRKVQEHFQAFYPHNSSNVSIYNWIVKYSKMINVFTDKLKIKKSEELQVDEMEYHRRHSRKTKKEVSKDWFIDSIDVKTRYMVNADYFKSRGQKEIKIVLGKAKYKTDGYVTTITTDGWQVYTKSVKQVFGYYNFQRGEKVHNVNISSKDEGFNIYIERLHNSIRERTKTFRGFHGSVESADSIMKGWAIYYNFIRKHLGINCRPYELAIPNFKLNSNNRWLELIQLSTESL
jgi:transposase-like protein